MACFVNVRHVDRVIFSIFNHLNEDRRKPHPPNFYTSGLIPPSLLYFTLPSFLFWAMVGLPFRLKQILNWGPDADARCSMLLVRRPVRGVGILGRLAVLLTKRLYRYSVIGDRPRNRAYYVLRYGSWTKLVNYLRVRRDYRSRRTAVRGYPHSVRVEPVSACNLHCPLCPTGRGEVDRQRMAMSAETLDTILAKCGLHAFYVQLWLWGEPLLNKNLADLVAVCRRRGLGSEISSHLSLPLSQQRIDGLIQAGLDWLIVSNDAASAETYSQYRIGGSFDLVVRNMQEIVARKRALGSPTPFVEWQFVPFRHNQHEMDEARLLAREIGVGLRFKPARLDKTRNLTFQGQIPIDLARQWEPNDPALVHITTPERNYYLDYHCTYLWGSVSVYADGAMAPCCETVMTRDDIGNIFSQEFEKIWNGPAYVQARRVALGLEDGADGKTIACSGCKVFKKPLARIHALPRPVQERRQ